MFDDHQLECSHTVLFLDRSQFHQNFGKSDHNNVGSLNLDTAIYTVWDSSAELQFDVTMSGASTLLLGIWVLR